MSLQILIAHTGLSLTPPSRFSSLESLQSWIASNANVASTDQILMTARGKPVKLQTLTLENELFVYSRQILSASTQASLSSSLPTTPTPDKYSPNAAPDGPSNQESLEAWQKFFKDRSSWAIDLQDCCSGIGGHIQQLHSEATIIQRSATIAVENVKQHIANLRPKYHDSSTWADNVLQDQAFLLDQWEGLVGKYPSIPAIKALADCLSGNSAVLQESGRSSSSESKTSLFDFVAISEITRASNTGKISSQRLRARTAELNVAFTDVAQKANSIVDNFSRDAHLSDSAPAEQADHLLEEIQVITKKIIADRDFVLRLSHDTNSKSQAARISLLHTRSFIPTLLQTVDDLVQVRQKAVQRKNNAQTSGVQYLQNISAVESRIALVHAKLAKLDINPEDGYAFEILGAVIRLPSVYGLLLVECVRRLEWTEKITADSSTLVEEVAIFKEEIKRRKKWIKDMGDVVDLGPLDGMSLGFDINVQAEKHNWPKVARRDIQMYTRTLQELKGFEDCIKEVETAFATLDMPTKRQSRRAKAFKNGSIHDTTLEQNSLLLRADDDILHTLTREKSKLEEKLKSSESRIRKLEDLLHRQSQIGRPSSNGNPFSVQAPPLERYNTSPVVGFSSSMAKPYDSASRRSSVSTKRVSECAESDEKNLSRKVASLEAELIAEKTHSATLQKDAAARLDVEDHLKAQVREAISTKEDLLGNFEAQQKEFDEERHLLEDENLKLKIRLEEAEDELDQVLGSRDHEARVHALEEELQKIREEADQEVRSACAQTDALRSECKMLHDANARLQEQHTDLQAEAKVYTLRLQDHEKANSEYHATLRSSISYLDPDSVVPDGLKESIRAIEAAIRKHKLNVDEMKKLVAQARSENLELESHLSGQNAEMQNLRDRLGNQEMEVFSTREILAKHREDLKRAQIDLEKERSDHRELKKKHQAAETQAESFQDHVTTTDNEIKALRTTIENYEARDRESIKQLRDLRRSHDVSTDRFIERGKRAETISQRFYTYISHLEKLLEQVGYAVTRQQGLPMAVQRVPKTSGTSVLLSSSGPLPTKAALESTPTPNYLAWATHDDPETEERLYGRFYEDFQTFDISVFQEAIIKRIKDTEHLARKWQREARGYRDKSHRAQSEAHGKIAFRSFKEGDLALFLPTRNQATRPWAAFNVGAPHYFLREQDSHKLRSRDWLLARISRVEERVVDLSKSMNGANGDRRSTGDLSDGASFDDENPFELSDGLRWYLLDAAEEKPGAPINVGLGKATVASASVDAKGSSIRPSRKADGNDGATKSLLTRSLDSRRSSTNSKKGQAVVPMGVTPDGAGDSEARASQDKAQPNHVGIGSFNGDPFNDAQEVGKNLL